MPQPTPILRPLTEATADALLDEDWGEAWDTLPDAPPLVLDRRYRTILADPPWPFVWQGGKGGRRRSRTALGYPTVTLEQIERFPVGRLAEQDAHLYLWVTPQLNRQGAGWRVAYAWGFDVVSEIVWEKPNLGTGAFPRACHEILLVCRRGKLPFAGPRNVRSVQRWPQNYGHRGGKWHSAKPVAAYDLIESASPGPYLEVFARQTALGWERLTEDFAVPSEREIADMLAMDALATSVGMGDG